MQCGSPKPSPVHRPYCSSCFTSGPLKSAEIFSEIRNIVRYDSYSNKRFTIPPPHYENMPVQHTAIFHGCINDNFQVNFVDYFHIFA